jgi:hypothetical protein
MTWLKDQNRIFKYRKNGCMHISIYINVSLIQDNINLNGI